MPNISIQELKKNIASGDLKSVYLLYGEESYLVNLYLKKLCDAVPDGGMADFNRLVISDKATSVSEISDYIETYPMMSDKKMLVIKDTGFIKSANEEMKEYWVELLKNVPDYIIIIFAEKEIDKRSVIYKAIEKAGFAAEFAKLSATDSVTWAERQVLSAKKKISKDNAQYLVELCDDGLENLKNEIDKLLNFCDEEITRSDIDRLVSKSLNTRIFEMTDAIMEHNADKALSILADMKTAKESAYNILFTLFSTFDKMLCACLMAENGEPLDAVAKALKVPPFIAKKYMRKSFGKDFLIECVTKPAEIDLAIKNGEIDDWTALEQFVMEMLK